MHTAYVSHISHIASFALASGGFASTVRLAKSSADMWVPILEENKENVLHIIDPYINKMQQFRDAINDGDASAIRSLIQESNKIKRILR